jgi:hypothetical protein
VPSRARVYGAVNLFVTSASSLAYEKGPVRWNRPRGTPWYPPSRKAPFFG